MVSSCKLCKEENDTRWNGYKVKHKVEKHSWKLVRCLHLLSSANLWFDYKNFNPNLVRAQGKKDIADQLVPLMRFH